MYKMNEQKCLGEHYVSRQRCIMRVKHCWVVFDLISRCLFHTAGLFRGFSICIYWFNSWGYSTKDASMAQWSIFAVLSSVPLWCLVLFCTGKIKRRVGWSWLCDLDPYSNSASLRCTRIRFMAFQANDLDLYTGSHQTGEHLDIARNAQIRGYHLVSRLSSGWMAHLLSR